MKIAYLGPKGSFSHHVVQTAFPQEELQAFANITDVIKAYEQGLVDYSVVPVENSIEGSVHETLDYLFHLSSSIISSGLNSVTSKTRLATSSYQACLSWKIAASSSLLLFRKSGR